MKSLQSENVPLHALAPVLVPVLAPELDLLPRQEALPSPVGPAPAEVLQRLAELREELAYSTGPGRASSAADREWRELPSNWRMALLMVAGVGLEEDLGTLAGRSWQRMQPEERTAVQSVIRTAKRHFARLVALAGRG